ncbi:MAG: sugar phosphate isomerase/epimerase [Marinilabiliaceae bacterium]|nr:sugar phosphate isomerase/epimerase [Marinilabiliaceae bacterium]
MRLFIYNRSVFVVIIVLSILLNLVSCRGIKNNSTAIMNVPAYKVGVVDLMILKRQKLGAFYRTYETGADGLELDMGGLGTRPAFDNKLVDTHFRMLFSDTAKSLNIEIASLSVSGFYAQSFPLREDAVKLVGDCIASMKLMGVKVGFLPLGVEGDLTKYPERRDSIVSRLQRVGKMAQDSGVIIGIETSLCAAEEVKLLNEIGSPAIQIYFNFSIPLKAGRDLYEEMNILGKDRICMIHATDEDGVWLENNTRIDMLKVKSTLDSMGWKGWLMVERSRDTTMIRDVVANYSANVKYLKSIFQNAKETK